MGVFALDSFCGQDTPPPASCPPHIIQLTPHKLSFLPCRIQGGGACLQPANRNRPLGWSACCEQIEGSSLEHGHCFALDMGKIRPPPHLVADSEGTLEKGVFASEAKRPAVGVKREL